MSKMRKEGYALKNEEGFYLESIKEGRRFITRRKYLETLWFNNPNLRNKKAMQIFLMPSAIKLAKYGIITKIVKFREEG